MNQGSESLAAVGETGPSLDAPAAVMPAVSEPENFSTALKSFQDCISAEMCALKTQIESSIQCSDVLTKSALQADIAALKNWVELKLAAHKNELLDVLVQSGRTNANTPTNLVNVRSTASVSPIGLSANAPVNALQPASSVVAEPGPSSSFDMTAEEDLEPTQTSTSVCGVCNNDCGECMKIMSNCGHYPYCVSCVNNWEVARRNLASVSGKALVDLPIMCPKCMKPNKSVRKIILVPAGDDVNEL